MKTITVSQGHGLEPGTLIGITVSDRRRWPRFVAWLLRRRPPSRTIYARLGKAVTATTLEVEGQP